MSDRQPQTVDSCRPREFSFLKEWVTTHCIATQNAFHPTSLIVPNEALGGAQSCYGLISALISPVLPSRVMLPADQPSVG